MIICSLSMSHTRSRATSLARKPQPYASDSTQRMKEDRLAQPCRFRRLLEQPAELARRQMTGATGKQPASFRRDAGVTPFRPRLPPLPQQVEDLGRKHHIPVLAAFRLHDADDHLLAVNVADPQPHHFAGPQPATIASVSIAQALRLVAMARTRLTSSGLNTGGS